MKSIMKLAAFLLFSMTTFTVANAQLVASVGVGYNYNRPLPPPVVYHQEGDYRQNDREVRDIRRDQEELERNFRIANDLNERIKNDCYYRDFEAERFDRNRLNEVNLRIQDLQRHIDRDAREIRHDRNEHNDRRERNERRDDRRW